MIYSEPELTSLGKATHVIQGFKVPPDSIEGHRTEMAAYDTEEE
jgi:hypothetical protein